MKILLGKQTFFKANLHTHTNISDGDFSPEEIKKRYREKGYSVVAFTDHEVFVRHNDLSDENFLALNGYELAVNENRPGKDFQFVKTYHLNLYAETPAAVCPPCFNENNIWIEHSKQYVTEEMRQIRYPLRYSVADINEIVRRSNESGFFVCYNHPVWSMQNPADYLGLKGLWGMEVYNTASDVVSLTDTDVPYSYMLEAGNKLYPVAADDAHKAEHIGGGFTMIDAKDLSYRSVIEALKRGDFYASVAPEIYKLYIDRGVLYVKTSPCAKICMLTNRRYTVCRAGKNVEEAEIPLKTFFEWNGKDDRTNDYFRIVAIDGEGKKAYTRAYYAEDFAG